MKGLIGKEVILWDFDGVILDSMPVRTRGFEIVLKDYPRDQVRMLMEFHLKNGGLSRYVKFRHFFKNIRKEEVSEEDIKELSEQFSDIMRRELKFPELLIADSLEFIEENYKRFNMHIVSGSDGQELRFLCQNIGIWEYFISIHGSPTPKKELVRQILWDHKYDPEKCVLIGDSINDYDAAVENHVDFSAYNNPDLKELPANYIEKFTDL